MRSTYFKKALIFLGVLTVAGCGAQSSQQQASTPTPPSSSSTSPPSSPSSSSSSSSASDSSPSPSSGSPSVGTSSPVGSAGAGQPSSPSVGSDTGMESNGDSHTDQGADATASSDNEAYDDIGDLSTGEQSDQAPSLGEDSPSDYVDFSEEETTAASANTGDIAAGSGGGTPAMSTAEQVAQMEAVLAGSISDYDGMILRERDYIANRSNAAGSEDALEEDEDFSGPLFDEIGGTRKDEGPGEAYETGPVATPTAGSGASGSPGAGRPSAPPPSDIPSGDDDDVVARQIREAAERETDPVLREKLWQEYRKYKNQSQ